MVVRPRRDVGGFRPCQMRAGSLVKPEQFVAIDDSTSGSI